MFFDGFDNEQLKPQLGGERFNVSYELSGTQDECRRIAQEICVEQSVEFPAELLPEGEIREQILGRIERFEQLAENRFEVRISYAVETASEEFTQFLNVIFGNFSIKSDVKVTDIELSSALYGFIKGPRFGMTGLRELVGEPSLPLLFTALKPMGLSAKELAGLAGIFAENGIHIIKDDHGLANQTFAPFRERVERCCDAVASANARSGHKAIYVPNVTAPARELRERALYAKRCGAGGLLVAPGLVGLDAMKCLADDDEIALPIFSHPAFSGCYAVNAQGFSCRAYFGQLMRYAGADAVIFPNYGGRFTFSKRECLDIAEAGKAPCGPLKRMFYCPAGGMKLERMSDMIKDYGTDVALLMGGGLFSCGPDLAQNCRNFAETTKKLCK